MNHATRFTKLALLLIVAGALALAGCGGDDGISAADQARIDAAEAAAAQAEADRIAAEEAAAAAAEAARLAAEEAAAAAEAEKQAAVEAARQAAIAEQQKMAVMAAITAAQDAVAALMDDSSDVDIAAAMADIAAATAAIAAASSLSEADMAMYNAQVTNIQASLTLAQANIRAYRAEKAAEEAMNQATAAERAKTAVENAIAALTAASEAETMSAATYKTAADTLAAAQQAVADADSDSLADASATLAAALIAASTAAADLGVKTQAVADATTALMAAEAALAEADPDHVALMAARAALAQAQMDKDDLTEQVAALQKQIEDLMKAHQKAEQDRMDEAERMAEEQRMKANAAKGKALQAALGATPLANLNDGGTGPTGSAVLSATGLAVQSHADATAGTPVAAVNLMAVKDSEGSLGDWKSMKYMHTDTGTKMANEAMVYTNQAAPSMQAFATGATLAGGTALTGYVAADRTLTFTADYAGGTDIAGDFPTAGTTNYTPTAPSTETLIKGTYQGASGTYRCTGATGCGATATAGGGVTFVGTWSFTHDVGAMVSIDDSVYLYFGWWLRTDDGDPSTASAFHGEFGDVEGGTSPATFANPATITGSATYTGKAAGKWAINHPINGGDAGHFTADATLTAKFGAVAPAANNGGISGTIGNFRLNDGSDDPGWSVKLNLAPWDGTTAGAFASTADTTNAVADGTVWSIDGNSATESGRWRGQMYDEALNPATANDGSNVPTSVTGMFESMFGSDHTMVGAFGAEK